MAGRAAVFAGQGAQFVGMGRDFADAHPACRALFEKADEVVGYPLSSICFEGPEEELVKSNHCQPAIFVVSTACHRALLSRSPEVSFSAMAGLSLGEWSALHAAGALTFEDTVRVLEARGRFMQESCEARAGGMISIIGLDRPSLDEISAATGLETANLNSSQQTVLSGDKAALTEAEKMAQEKGAKRAVILNVAGAYHSSFMNDAAEKLAAFLRDIPLFAPTVPVVANVTGAPHQADPEKIRKTMVRQVNSSVNWLSCVEWMQGNGVTEYVECGPGKVLSGLIKRIDRAASLHTIQDLATLEKTVEAIASDTGEN